MLRRLFVAICIVVSWGGFAGRGGADEAKAPRFLRVERNDRGDVIALKTPIVRFLPKQGDSPTVDLVGAVHIADKSYFEQLNGLFKAYDAVLFELVAAEGTQVPKDREKRGAPSPVTSVQQGMKSMLDLSFQLDCIDYSAANFIHADMSPEEFSRSMKDRGESFSQMFFRMLGQNMAMQGRTTRSNVSVLSLLFSRDRNVHLKRMLAEQFDDLDGQMELFDGPDGSTIITERNKKAFEVLARELKTGKKRLAVFYGAGHLPDMERRLLADGYRRDTERWITAWSLGLEAPKR